MPKAIIVCAVLAQYRVGSLEMINHEFQLLWCAQYRVGSLESLMAPKLLHYFAQYRVGSLEISSD